MNNIRKSILGAAVAIILGVAPRAWAETEGGETTTVCKPTGECFEYRCLPSIKVELQKVPELEVCLAKIHASLGNVEKLDRTAVVNRIKTGCGNAKGSLRMEGATAVCVVPVKATSSGASNPKTACEAGGGVWAGPKGAETCTSGPRK